MSFSSIFTSIFTDLLRSRLLTLLGLILLQVLLAVALALKCGVFEWRWMADFYRAMVVPFVLGWLAFVVVVRLATADLLGPEYSVLVGDGVTWLAWLAVVASLGARIIDTAKELYGSVLPFGGGAREVSEGVISALIGALSGVIAAYLTLRVNMQRNRIETPKLYADANLTNAEASSKLNGISLAMVQSYKDEVNRLYNEIGTMRERLGQMECRVNDLENEIQNKERRFADLLSGAHILYNQLAGHSIIPNYTPPERREGD